MPLSGRRFAREGRKNRAKMIDIINLAVPYFSGPFAQPWAATAVLMASLPPALNVFVIARQNETWIEPASVAVLIGTFASVVTLTSVMWFIQTGRLAFP
jgi:malonate transporter